MKFRIQALFVFCFATGLGVMFICLSGPATLERVGLGFHDFLQFRFPAKQGDNVALILVDTASVQALAQEQKIYFPFPRALYAELLKTAKSLGAKAVGLDLIFSEPSARGPEDDLTLAAAIESVGIPVVFASGIQAPEPAEAYRKVKGLAWGNTDLVPSVDGLFRKTGNKESSFSRLLVKGLISGTHRHQGWIHFGRADHIPTVPIYNVLQSAFDPQLKASLETKLRNRVWVVGYSAPGLMDLKPTPVNVEGVGPALQAALIENQLSGLEGVSAWGKPRLFLSFLALFLIWIFAVLVIRPQVPFNLFVIATTCSVLMPVLGSLGLWALPRGPIWMDPMPLILSMLFATGIHFLIKVRKDWRERIQFARTIESSMSREMLSLIEKGEVKIQRYGEKREVCILFADLAGFTTLSEELEPEKLMELMNDYLDESVDLIISCNGYVDKFIGDAIMALWGAPVKASADVDHAVKAALSFEKVTERCRAKWERKYGRQFPIHTRVGLHLGNVVVGNLGSKRRFNYTALGDSVNLASRLEGVGKIYQQQITVSGDLLDHASPQTREMFFCVDVIAVKGKDQPTRIYTNRGSYSEEMLAGYDKAFQSYVARNWDSSLAELDALIAEGKTKVPGATFVLIERCRRLKMGKDLEKFKDGIWYLDEK